MKLPHFALAAFIVLLAAAGYLTIKSDFESKFEEQRDLNQRVLAAMEELKKQQQERQAAVPAPAPAPVRVEEPAPVPAAQSPAPSSGAAVNPAPSRAPSTGVADVPPDLLAQERALLDEARKAPELPPVAPEAPMDDEIPTGPRLTAVQRKIMDQPAIARVLEYSAELGAVILDRGSKVNLEPGQEYSIRRRAAVIGKLRISDTIEPDQCVADVLPGSMPPGMVPVPGDEVILFTP